MLIPILNVKTPLVKENKEMTEEWSLLFIQLFNQLQTYLSNEGTVIPSLTSSEISENSDMTNPNVMPDGTLYYNIDTNKLLIKINGIVKEIVTI